MSRRPPRTQGADQQFREGTLSTSFLRAGNHDPAGLCEEHPDREQGSSIRPSYFLASVYGKIRSPVLYCGGARIVTVFGSRNCSTSCPLMSWYCTQIGRAEGDVALDRVERVRVHVFGEL